MVARIIDGDDELKKNRMSPIIAAIASRLLKIIKKLGESSFVARHPYVTSTPLIKEPIQARNM